MELKINIGFDELLGLVKQLPKDRLIKLKTELDRYAMEAETAHIERSDWDALFQSAPVMSDEQYRTYLEFRKKFNS